jgi:hypothetical protein
MRKVDQATVKALELTALERLLAGSNTLIEIYVKSYRINVSLFLLVPLVSIPLCFVHRTRTGWNDH